MGTRSTGLWRWLLRGASAALIVTTVAVADSSPADAAGGFCTYDPASRVATIGGTDDVPLAATDAGSVLMWAQDVWDPDKVTWTYQWLPCAFGSKFVTLDIVDRIDVRLEGERTWLKVSSTGWWNGEGDLPKPVLSGLAAEEIRVDGERLTVSVSAGPGDENLRAGAGGIDADGDGKLNILTATKPELVHFDGRGGNDVLDARSTDAPRAELKGGDGVDILYGTTGDDFLFGHEGGDLIVGGAGNDAMQGDAGDDQLYGGDGDDTLSGWAGHDFLNAGPGALDTCIIDNLDVVSASCELIK